MASTLLEQTREAHEEVERLERAIVGDFKTEAVTHKERLLQNHRVNRMLDEMVKKTKRLVRPWACRSCARGDLYLKKTLRSISCSNFKCHTGKKRKK